MRPVNAAEAREMFPPLAESARALHNPDAARIDGRLLARALLEAGERRGLERRPASADSLILEGSRIAGVLSGGDRISAGTVVIAGGAWSRRFSDPLGIDIPVAPQRGQIIHLDLGATDTSSWPIVSAFRDHYLVPWPDSRVAAGATRETGSGFEPKATAAGIVEVLSEALRVAPGLAGASIRETRVGLRPLSADGMPVMGVVPGWEGLYLNTGHGAQRAAARPLQRAAGRRCGPGQGAGVRHLAVRGGTVLVMVTGGVCAPRPEGAGSSGAKQACGGPP